MYFRGSIVKYFTFYFPLLVIIIIYTVIIFCFSSVKNSLLKYFNVQCLDCFLKGQSFWGIETQHSSFESKLNRCWTDSIIFNSFHIKTKLYQAQTQSSTSLSNSEVIPRSSLNHKLTYSHKVYNNTILER